MKNAKHRLTARQVVTLGPGKYADGAGLYLIVGPNGSRTWLKRYTSDGRRRELGLGPTAKVSLARARELAGEADALLGRGLDPLAHKAALKAEEKARLAGQETFGSFVDRWVKSTIAPGLRSAKQLAQWKMTLGDKYCEAIRRKTVSEIGTADILAVLKEVWTKRPETASRLRARLARALDAATVEGLRDDRPNPARWQGHLELMLGRPSKLNRKHHKAMPWCDVPAHMVRLKQREAVAAFALQFIILTAARSGEALGATWEEIDLVNKIWIVPAHRMKSGVEHRVPLSSGAFEIVEAMKPLNTGEPGALIFPGPTARPMGPEALEALRRRMGRGEYTTHGFRSSFRDWAGEATSAPWEIAERCLAHAVGSAVERAYRRGDALEKRRALLQAWGDYCEGKAGAEILAFGYAITKSAKVQLSQADQPIGPSAASA